MEDPEHSIESKKRKLFEAILAIKNVKEMRSFFEDLCTPVELQDMADRWAVVGPLKENIPYRKIYELTGVSVTTVGRVARSLHYGSGGYGLIFERLRKTKKEGKEKRPGKRK